MEEESIFEQAQAEAQDEALEENNDLEQEETDYSEWKPRVSKESPKDRLERKGVKENRDGQVLTIKETFFTRPKMTKPDGTKIPPKETLKDKKEYYPGKLGIKFEEDNLVEYYPNFHYFVNENGEVSDFAKINRDGDNEVSALFRLVVAKLDRPVEEVSDQDFYDFLVGKKVKIKTEEGTYLGKKWFRNNIVEFI